jgi:hypothetical protein
LPVLRHRLPDLLRRHERSDPAFEIVRGKERRQAGADMRHQPGKSARLVGDADARKQTALI